MIIASVLAPIITDILTQIINAAGVIGLALGTVFYILYQAEKLLTGKKEILEEQSVWIGFIMVTMASSFANIYQALFQ